MSASLILDVHGHPIGIEHTLQPLPDLTKRQAEAFGYFEGVLKRYKWAEILRCQICYRAKRIDGCDVKISSRYIEIRCRCGIRKFTPPKGTTDLVQARSNSAIISDNETFATIEKQDGTTINVKATRLEPEDGRIMQMYRKVCDTLQLKSQLVHLDCWTQRVVDEACAQVMITDDKIAVVCDCHTWHWQDRTVG